MSTRRGSRRGARTRRRITNVGRAWEWIDRAVAVRRGDFCATAMDSVVPAEITAELTQILSNLVQGDNEIRQKCAPLLCARLIS